ncbi:hypothetical protein ABFX02_02G147100 [Erythranthe guttata]
MNQCVPSWDFDDNFAPPRVNFHANEHSNSTNHVPSLDYEVAELTWENGQLAMHGLGQPRVVNKPTPSHAPTKYATWEKPRAGGTLESIVNQATGHAQLPKFAAEGGDVCDNDLVPWIDHHRAVASHAGAARTDADASVTMTMDALVPCNNGNLRRSTHENQERHSVRLPLGPAVAGNGGGTCMVGSCSGAGIPRAGIKRRSCRNDDDRSVSVSGSATCWGSDGSRQLTADTWEREFGGGGGGGGFTSATSLASPEYTRTSDDRDDSVCHSISHQTCHERKAEEETGKRKGNRESSVSTKRSRAAAIHNQSERKRRDKINQRMKTLQKLVPNSSKSDKASMLDEVIEHLKQLQGQLSIMSRMNMTSPMMLPLAMQHQQQQLHQMSMMGMGMGMAGMGMGVNVMDINAITLAAAAAAAAGMPPVIHPSAAFNKPWDSRNPGDCLPTDPLSAFLACQSQPTTMDAYSRMATLYQQYQLQPPGSGSGSGSR